MVAFRAMNILLAHLPSQEAEAVDSAFEAIEVGRYFVLAEHDAPITHIYFPDTAVVSQIVALPEGSNVEAAMIGCEGAVGIGGGMAGGRWFARQLVQVPGEVRRATRAQFTDLFDRCPELRKRILVYRDVFAAQLQQSIACSIKHSAEERFARFVLEMCSRGGGNEMSITHEYMAMLIGIGRPTVTLLMRSFEAANLVRGRRGGITVMDHEGLQAISCSCFATIRDVYLRAGIAPPDPRKCSLAAVSRVSVREQHFGTRS
jgi:Crp-like helix-turn-helix domain